MKGNRKLVGLILITLIVVGSACQKTIWDTPVYQKMTIEKGDSLVEFRITDEKIEASLPSEYYWYNNGKIKSTTGGYNGQLLNGEYSVADLKGNLRVKGYFDKGLKSKQWTKWSGDKIQMTEYKDGMRNGEYQEFENGKLVFKGEYSQNARHGKFFRYEADTTIVQTFKKGRLETKEIDEKE